MWREKLEAFWDGSATLALGFFGANDLAGFMSPRSELFIVSYADVNFKTGGTLLDVIDLGKSTSGIWIVTLPPRHSYVLIQAREDEQLLLSLMPESQMADGDWRMLMTELPSGRDGEFFRVATRAAAADGDRFGRDQVDRSGDRLIWALRQRRKVETLERVTVAMRISPSQRIWPPNESSVTIEAIEPVPVRPNNPPPAPFAVLDLWQREQPPKVKLRIRVENPDSDADNGLERMSVVHVMNQRRFLREWIKTQKAVGDPIIDPLTFEDVQVAVGDPREMPNAVYDPGWTALFNLSKILSMTQPEELDGVFVRPLPRTATLGGVIGTEIEFFAATLGDDVGIVSNWARDGDIVVYPEDPGGSYKARLLRIGIDGAAALPIDDGDPMLKELLARVADDEGISVARSEPRPTDSATDRQTAFLAQIKKRVRDNALFATIDTQSRWDDLAPLKISSFGALTSAGGQAGENALRRLGGYAAFRADPAVASMLACHPDLIADVPNNVLSARQETSSPLPRRLAVIRGSSDLVAQNLELPLQIQAWRILADPAVAQRLTTARISLGGSVEAMASAGAISSKLSDERVVEEAADFHEDQDALDDAEALRGYLRQRHNIDRWIPLTEVVALARLVDDAIAHEAEFSEETVDRQFEPAPLSDNRKPAQLRADIEAILDHLGQLVPPLQELARLEKRYREYVQLGKADRRVLRKFEAQLTKLADLPAENRLYDDCVTALENWAGLPAFLLGIEPRLNRAGTGQVVRSKILTQYVNRTSQLHPRRNGKATSFDKHREALAASIGARLGPTGRDRGAQRELVEDIFSFADILIFHKGYKAISMTLPELVKAKISETDVRRLEDGLARWPRGAPQSWDFATSIMRSHFPEGLAQLEAAVAPPEI
jgi:hypothetical protein